MLKVSLGTVQYIFVNLVALRAKLWRICLSVCLWVGLLQR